MSLTTLQLQLKSIHYRKRIFTMIKRCGAGHTGGSLSCTDILNVLYNNVLRVSPETFTDPNRDRYVQSKGHSVEALYAVLADVGFFHEEELDTLNQYQSHFVGHPTRMVNGIEQNTGALGHGLPIAVGMAIAGKIDRRDYKVYTLLGDGELAEGSNWEASIAAAHYKLDNLVAIVDHNGLQITGKTTDVMSTEPLAQKFMAFGYAVRSVDGNNVADLVDLFAQIPFEAGKPNMIIANTVKGKGISFTENAVDWHHHVPTDAEYAQAMQELTHAEEMLLASAPRQENT